jgi:predicted MFS family arabinose efflux permease
MVLIFNILDTVGRFLGGAYMLKDSLTIVLAYSRSIFIVTFLLIAFNIAPSWLFGKEADWFKIINMALFSFSNGYLSTMLAIRAPSRAHDDSKEQVGLFVGISITIGILIGSIIAIGFGSWVPNPPIS